MVDTRTAARCAVEAPQGVVRVSPPAAAAHWTTHTTAAMLPERNRPIRASSSCLFGYEPVHTELCVYIGRLF